MELTEEIQRDPGRFLQNVDMTKIKTKEDLREALRRQDTTDKRGRDWEESISRVVERSESLFGTDEVQSQVAGNIQSEIESLSEDELENYSIATEINTQDKNRLQSILNKRIDSEIIKEVRMFKSKAQKSMKAPIILTIEEKDKKLLAPFIEDLKAVTASQKIETGKFNIKLVE